ncbi:DUF4811 domain-containing protein [Furfurilactobacillus sp. WILCCON 0119]
MVISLLVISTLGLFMSIVLLDSGAIRHCLIGLFLIGFLGMMGLLIANDNYHYGLKKVNTSQTVTLVSSVKGKLPVNMLLYQPLGNGTEKVYLYRTNASEKKPQPIPTKKITTTVHQTTASEATLVKTTTRWEYKNHWMKFLFALSGEKNTVQHHHYTFNVPATWLTLSTAQAKQLAKVMKDPAKQQAITATVAKQVLGAVAKNPRLTAAQRADVQQRALKQALEAALN